MTTETAIAPCKILIVEDETAIAMEIHSRVAEMGHTPVGPAVSGHRALTLAERERPDLALMDVNLVGPLDGIETAARLRERFDIPVIFLTAYSNPEMVARAKPVQPLGWLVKPFGDRELQITIEFSLQRHAVEQELRAINRHNGQLLAEVRQLSGLLPICMTCKKIRDDHDCWKPVEEYIGTRTDAQFSHGYCPDCYREFLRREGLGDETESPGQPS